MQKTLFLGTYWGHAGSCVFGPFLRAGCAGAEWVRGGSLGSGMGARRRCLTPRAGCVRWSSAPCIDADACGRCAGERVGGWATRCLPGVRGRVCVGAWAGATSSGSFGAFAPITVWDISRLLRGGRVLLLRDNGLLMLLGSRHTTRPAHAGVSGHRTTVSPHVLYCVPTNPGPRSFCAWVVRRCHWPVPQPIVRLLSPRPL
jgi:hypothetical protein